MARRQRRKVINHSPNPQFLHSNCNVRSLVKSTIQTSLAVSRNVAKAGCEARLEKKPKALAKAKAIPEDSEEETKRARAKSPEAPQMDKFVGRQKEFQSTSSSAPRRLDGIAQAPPEFKKLPRGVTTAIGMRGGALSMSRKVMMEEEREKDILRYRQLKADRRQKDDVGDKLENDS